VKTAVAAEMRRCGARFSERESRCTSNLPTTFICRQCHETSLGFLQRCPRQRTAEIWSPVKMSKVIGHTPPWLSRPSPGAKIFSDPAPESPASPSKRSSYLGTPPSADYQGPRRLVASRGTELFTVVGNKIRWADLAAVRDEWEENSHSGSSRFGLSRSGGDAPEQQAYRVCQWESFVYS
jgi:hypothetical protein